MIYPHYETLARSWGPDPVWDQVLGATLMALFFIIAYAGRITAVGSAWMNHSERSAARAAASKPKVEMPSPNCDRPVELVELGRQGQIII